MTNRKTIAAYSLVLFFSRKKNRFYRSAIRNQIRLFSWIGIRRWFYSMIGRLMDAITYHDMKYLDVGSGRKWTLREECLSDVSQGIYYLICQKDKNDWQHSFYQAYSKSHDKVIYDIFLLCLIWRNAIECLTDEAIEFILQDKTNPAGIVLRCIKTVYTGNSEVTLPDLIAINDNTGLYDSAVYWLGRALSQQGRHKEAIRCFEVCHKIDLPDTYKLLKLKAIALFNDGQYEHACSLFHEIPKRKRGEVTRQYIDELADACQYGVYYFEEGNLEKAYPFLKYESQCQKDFELAMLYQASIDAVKAKDETIINRVVDQVKGALDEDLVMQVAGATLWEIGQLEKGFALMRKAVEIKPSQQNINVLVSRLPYQDAYYNEIETLYCRLINDFPEDINGWIGYSDLMLEKNEYDQALTYIKKAEEIGSNEAAIYQIKGAIFKAGKQYKASYREYVKALKSGFWKPQLCWSGIAENLFYLNKRVWAKHAADRAIAIDKDCIEALNILEKL